MKKLLCLSVLLATTLGTMSAFALAMVAGRLIGGLSLREMTLDRFSLGGVEFAVVIGVQAICLRALAHG